jgi:predicted TIM-barrel fold metal-dependent hydrolase
MPYFLERAEQVIDKQRYWVSRGTQFMDYTNNNVDLSNFDVRQLFRDHIYGCIIEDHHAISSIEEIGEDNIMIETDYPHSDSTWPNSIEVAKKMVAPLTPDQQYKILRGNAERLYRFTPAAPPVVTSG